MNVCSELCFIDWMNVAIDLFVPLVVVVIAGFVSKRYVDRLERRRLLFHIRSTWRTEVFRELQVNLNNIFCYFTYQGNWRAMSPDDATAAKRASDRAVYMNIFLWSEEFLQAYEEYKEAAFIENQGPGKSFLFRANITRHKESPKWESTWERRFVPEGKRVKREIFIDAYNKMFRLALRDLENN